jgi:hypothetical protein
MVTADVDALDPKNQPLTLASGTVVDIVPLRTREFFKLVKIITNGAGPVLPRMDLFSGDSTESEFVGKLVSLVIMSVPNAEDDAIEFLQAMVKPTGLIDRPYLEMNKADRERNETLWQGVLEVLHNPEIDDTISIIEAVIQREAGDLQRLGKRLRKMMEVAQKTGQLTSEDQNSSEGSAVPSTLSAVSTTGTTSESKTSPSDEQDKSSRQSRSGGRTKKETVAAL